VAATRRQFIHAGALTTMAFVWRDRLAGQQQRRYGDGPFAVKLGSVSGGWLDNFEGGGVRADPASTAFSHEKDSSLGVVTFDDLVLSCGLRVSEAFNEFLRSSFASNSGNPIDVTIADSGRRLGNRVQAHVFIGAVLSKIAFPRVDASSKDLVRLVATFRVSAAEEREEDPALWPELPSQNPPPWRASEFRLSIAGIDCGGVRLIEVLSASRAVVGNQVGQQRQYSTTVTPWSSASLGFVIPGTDAAAFEAWYRETLSGAAALKDGLVEYGPVGHPHHRVRLQGLRAISVRQEPGRGEAAAGVRVQALASGVSLE